MASPVPGGLRWLMVSAGFQALSFVALLVWTAYPVPVIDLIPVLADYFKQGLSPSWLLPLHNGHSLVLYRLVLAGDLALTGGHVQVLAAVSLAVWVIAFFMIVGEINRLAPSQAVRRLGTIVLALVMFRVFLLECFVIPNGFNYPIVAFCLVAGTVAVAGIDGSGPFQLRAALAALAALAASLCLANGLLLFPILAVLAVFRSRRMTALLPFSAVAVPALAVYMTGWNTELPSFDFGAFIGIWLFMFGAPWVLKAKVLGLGASLAIVAAALFVLSRCILHWRAPSRAETIVSALIAFGLGTATLIGVGRQDLGVAVGTSGRYGLTVSLVHAAILVACVQAPQLASARVFRRLVALSLLGAFVLLGEQIALSRLYLRQGRQMQTVAARVRAGDRSPETLMLIYPAPELAASVLDEFARRRLYGFGE